MAYGVIGGNDDDYDRGLRLLESLITGKKRQDGTQWEHAFDMMQCYLERLDLVDTLPKLHAIHVAGTKGKGSTCAIVESILRQCGYRTGLFTSPHLIDVRERIRINGQKIDKDTFLKHLFETYSILDEKTGEDSGKPAYFRFLTLLCFRIFLELSVDVAILEVGLGGRLDATNCIREPVVCGVTALGFDHMNVLGYTLPEISREKAGIFKAGCPAYTVPQRDDAMETLETVAQEKQTPLEVVPKMDLYHYFDAAGTKRSGSEIKIGLAGEHQIENTALAVRLAAVWESRYGKYLSGDGMASERSDSILKDFCIPKEYRKGIESARWPGRAEIFDDAKEDNITYFVDGAHTSESLAACASWFSSASKSRERNSIIERFIVFNCMEERDPASLLEPLQTTLHEHNTLPQEIIFSPTMSSYTKLNTPNDMIDTTWQATLKDTWQRLYEARFSTGQPGDSKPGCSHVVSKSLSDTLHRVRMKSKAFPNKKIHVLITGSLYLVGDMLNMLGKSA
ncbi:hypothetical protein M9434_002907 [Picochlorum sp. BPE23]|nr:hypothetical protein M9434_002907 [Picochlorum sp. BPE23]